MEILILLVEMKRAKRARQSEVSTRGMFFKLEKELLLERISALFSRHCLDRVTFTSRYPRLSVIQLGRKHARSPNVQPSEANVQRSKWSHPRPFCSQVDLKKRNVSSCSLNMQKNRNLPQEESARHKVRALHIRAFRNKRNAVVLHCM